ncbi:putative tRNA pseudouridine synthase [Platanthera zijinensis]|uniref:tRNA pseudouridine synthase n=1 Tax=Platanthera zijinensis TaxID=2320716 RepID=A0AAP0FU95_9ASPA
MDSPPLPKKLKMSMTSNSSDEVDPTSGPPPAGASPDPTRRRYKRRKVAIFLSYCGAGYQGMQKNPGARTIEGELEEALFLAGAVPESDRGNSKRYDWARSARTDKGVSASGQVVSGRFYIDPPGFIDRLNHVLADSIRILGFKRVTSSFNAKKFCDRRRYVYLLPVFALDPNSHPNRESVLASFGSENELSRCFDCSERGRKVVGVVGRQSKVLKEEEKSMEVEMESSLMNEVLSNEGKSGEEKHGVCKEVEAGTEAAETEEKPVLEITKVSVGENESEFIVFSDNTEEKSEKTEELSMLENSKILDGEEEESESPIVLVDSNRGVMEGATCNSEHEHRNMAETEEQLVVENSKILAGEELESECNVLVDSSGEKMEGTTGNTETESEKLAGIEATETEVQPVLENNKISAVEGEYLESNVIVGSIGEKIEGCSSSYCYGDKEREAFVRILKRYEGTHNFHNFTTRIKAEDPSARRYIISFNADSVMNVGGIDFIKCEVVGQSFMLHQIRKMIGFAVAVMRKCAPESLMDIALRRDVNINVPTAPEVGLYLDECFFSSYNKKWKDSHEEVSMEAYADEAENFKLKYIYSHIASMEHKEGAVALWLHSLNHRNYPDFRWGETKEVQVTVEPSDVDHLALE